MIMRYNSGILYFFRKNTSETWLRKSYRMFEVLVNCDIVALLYDALGYCTGLDSPLCVKSLQQIIILGVYPQLHFSPVLSPLHVCLFQVFCSARVQPFKSHFLLQFFKANFTLVFPVNPLSPCAKKAMFFIQQALHQLNVAFRCGVRSNPLWSSVSLLLYTHVCYTIICNL